MIIFGIYWKPKYDRHNLKNIRCFALRDVQKFPECLVDNVNDYMILNSVEHLLGYSLTTANNRMWYDIGRTFEGWMWREDDAESGKRELNLCFKKGAMVIPRSEDVKFAGGMIVTHHVQSTDLPTCTGVIIGWHRDMDRHVELSIEDDCDFTDIGLLNHCRNSYFWMQQTNYIILIDKNEMCYVEEDNITLTTPKWIENSEIGRYFCKFEGTHYVPNKMLASIYPQDAAITAAITAKSEN